MKFICLILTIFLIGCSDFALEKNIYKKYYLIGVDTKQNISISYKLQSGDFIGRVEWVTEYVVVRDSLIFAKSVDQFDKSGYYILDMSKDFEYAKIEDVIRGPIDSATFINNWAKRYNVKLISVFDNSED